MRFIAFFIAIFLLVSCANHVTEAWSWDRDQQIFVPHFSPDLPQIFVSGISNIASHTTSVANKTPVPSLVNKQQYLSDIDNDGMEEVFELSEGHIIARENNEIFWTSPDDWDVTSIVMADSTNDGIIDINIAAWRAANYGPSRPFWEVENDLTPRHHFFVMKMQDNRVLPVWQSSNLESINQEFLIGDVTGDGRNELVVIEQKYSETRLCRDTAVAVWQWNQWGFSLLWRSERGDYCGLGINSGDAVIKNTKDKIQSTK